MNVKVYRADLDAAALSTLVATLRDKTSFAILERPDKVKFPGPDEALDPTAWPSGRVFSEEMELRWEQEGGVYRAVLTRSDGAEPPTGFTEVLALDGPEPELVWYYLWGEDEVAVGGRLNYSRAIPGRGRGQLGVVEYRDEAGRLTWYRYLELKREGEDA